MMEHLVSVLIYILFICILLVRVEYVHNINVKEKEMLGYFNNLRGIFALEIIIGHVIRTEKTLLYPFGIFMIVSVAFFFFVSGYGLTISCNTKNNYLKNFLKVKCGNIVIMIVIAYLFHKIVCCIAGISEWKTFGIDLFSVTNWYLFELLFFYIIFYLVSKYIKKYRWVIITIITCIAMTIVFYAGWKESYYASALGFSLGIFAGEYYEKVQSFVSSFKGRIIIILGCVGGMCSLFTSKHSFIGMVGLRNLICVSGILLLFWFLLYFRPNNRILGTLKKYSAELYLFQFPWLRVTEAYFQNWIIRMVIVIFMTFISAWLMHFVLDKIKIRK